VNVPINDLTMQLPGVLTLNEVIKKLASVEPTRSGLRRLVSVAVGLW